MENMDTEFNEITKTSKPTLLSSSLSFLSTMLLLPLSLLLITTATLTVVSSSMMSVVIPSKGIRSTEKPNLNEETYLLNDDEPIVVNDNDRIYDIVLYGASGFTGRLASLYVAKTYGNKIRWCIAGRSIKALEEIKRQIYEINPDLSVPILIADANDKEALLQIVKHTKVVVSTAGPFALYGENIVKLCAKTGTHYCDITGETDWVREMIDKYDNVAQKTGARVVFECGHDSVPWDLSVLRVSQLLAAKGESLKEVRCYNEINGQVSGGTLATIFNSLLNRRIYKAKLGYDPLLKTSDGSKASGKFIAKNQSLLGYSKEFRSWIGPSLMASVICNCVKRSNALNNYNPNTLVYKESAVYSNFFEGFSNVMSLVSFGSALMIPPLRWFLRSYVLPKPGEGPSESQMDAGYLKITTIGEGTSGGKARAVILFKTDPGIITTIIIIIIIIVIIIIITIIIIIIIIVFRLQRYCQNVSRIRIILDW